MQAARPAPDTVLIPAMLSAVRRHIIEEHGEVHVDIQRRIKRALDPRNIMNPTSMFTIDGAPVPQQAHQTGH
jgi:hypothetical protein